MKKLVLSLSVLSLLFTGCSEDEETTTPVTPATGEITGDFTANKTYRDWETDRKSTRLNSSHSGEPRMPSSA